MSKASSRNSKSSQENDFQVEIKCLLCENASQADAPLKTMSAKSKLDIAIEKVALSVANEMRQARQMLGDLCKNGECD